MKILIRSTAIDWFKKTAASERVLNMKQTIRFVTVALKTNALCVNWRATMEIPRRAEEKLVSVREQSLKS